MSMSSEDVTELIILSSPGFGHVASCRTRMDDHAIPKLKHSPKTLRYNDTRPMFGLGAVL